MGDREGQNSKFFYGIINKKRSQLSIRGVFVDGDWNTDREVVKDVFKDQFATRFKQPAHGPLKLNISFPNRLSTDQVADMDRSVSRDEISVAVWNCGENKSPCPDGYTFEFFRRYWRFIGSDFCSAVECFFKSGSFSKGKRKITWVYWDKVRKWRSRSFKFSCVEPCSVIKVGVAFFSQDGSLWYRVIQALYGASFELHHVNQSSIWCSILRKMQVLISKGFDFVSHCKKRVGDGHNTRFWYDSWVFDQPLRVRFPRLFALETDKESTVASKLGSSSVKYIPIKINVFAWRARLDHLPTRSNLVHRGVVLDYSLCPLCGLVPEDIYHVLFRCDTAKLVFRRNCRWWDLDRHDLLSFSDWNAWFSAIRLPSRIKLILEGVFYVAWWHLWVYRN
uniref:RNA-directed DNA polymerase, eukaryota n=1 Tax=Tanacetum cinerariifolium TaxID=118510 RepID=A0A6L2J8N2_TANCI|nr:RNA-directed DNA polymerase, eukaryota [Tanacetum cinerariifolium]